MKVAAVSSRDRITAEVEIAHYASMYSQDGEVEIREITKRPLRTKLK